MSNVKEYFHPAIADKDKYTMLLRRNTPNIIGKTLKIEMKPGEHALVRFY